MYPHPDFWYRGTCQCTLVPVFGTGEHLNVPLSRFLVQAKILQKHPFGNHPFANPRKGSGRSQHVGMTQKTVDCYALVFSLHTPHFYYALTPPSRSQGPRMQCLGKWRERLSAPHRCVVRCALRWPSRVASGDIAAL